MKVDFSILNKLKFMEECKITPNEHETLIGVLMAQDEEYQDEGIYRAEQSCPSHIPNTEYLRILQGTLGRKGLRETLFSLQEKGLILKTCKLPDPEDITVGLTPNEIVFNKNILKKYLRHSGEMFLELFWAYPKECVINGRITSLRNTFGNGGWSNIDEAASFYGQRIQYNAQTHEHIIALIEQAKEQGLINMGIVKFLRGEEWHNLEAIVEGTFDPFKE